MKHFRYFIKGLAVAALLAFTTGVQAQDAQKPQEATTQKQRGGDRFQQLSERLKLTADQQTKLKAVMQQNRAEMKKVREENKAAEKDVKRKAMMSQMQKNDENIKALLDENQKLEYAKWKEEKKAEMKARKEKRTSTDNEDDEL